MCACTCEWFQLLENVLHMNVFKCVLFYNPKRQSYDTSLLSIYKDFICLLPLADLKVQPLTRAFKRDLFTGDRLDKWVQGVHNQPPSSLSLLRKGIISVEDHWTHRGIFSWS